MASRTEPDNNPNTLIDDNISIVGFIGPPGAGKGTQCSLLARDLQFQHLSIGALMREESNRHGSIHAAMIRANQMAGRLNPKELSIPLLLRNINAAWQTGIRRFVLDGFPRDLDQSEYFASNVKSLSLVILLECPEQVYTERLLGRGRFDDNLESIKGRMNTYNESTSEVIAAYESAGILERVRGDRGVDIVQENIRQILLKRSII